MYSTKGRVPRKWSRTRSRAASPNARAPSRSLISVPTVLPNSSRSVGSSISNPDSPCTTWSWIPPTLPATTGRAFHIASATVSPNPSAMLFWTTTSERRWIAFTIAAFSSTSSIGRVARWTLALMSGGSDSRRSRIPAIDPYVLGKSVQEPTRILEAVPARHLTDEGSAVGDRSILIEVGGAVDARLASVHPVKERLAEVLPLPELGDGEDRADRLRLQVLVLRGEDVDRGWDEPDLRRVEALPDEPLAGEDTGIGLLDIAAQKRPALASQIAGVINADVAAPDDLDLSGDDMGDQTGRLWVVDVDDVPLLNEPRELVRRLEHRLLIDPPLRGSEGAAVAGGIMQSVMEPVGDPEELRVPGDRQPAEVDAGTAAVREQRMEHLGHAAAARGRVDVPHHPAAEHLLGGRRRLLDLGIGLAQQRPEPLRRNRPDRNLLQCAH